MFTLLKCVVAILLSLHFTVFGKDAVQPLPVDQTQLACLTEVIYNEASGESLNGKIAVGQVVLNRVAHGFETTPCKVVYQSNVIRGKKICQFTMACSRKKIASKNAPSYSQSREVAKELLTGAKKEVVSKTTLYFHNTTVRPRWKLIKTAQIGNHIFYAKRS